MSIPKDLARDGQCKGLTKAGHQCTNRPKENGYCGHHQPKSVEPVPPPVDNGFRFEFMDIAREVREEMLTFDVAANTRPQYWNLIISCVKNAKEEQRILDGIGVGVTYICNTTPPQGERPTPPDDEPTSAIEDERVLN